MSENPDAAHEACTNDCVEISRVTDESMERYSRYFAVRKCYEQCHGFEVGTCHKLFKYKQTYCMCHNEAESFKRPARVCRGLIAAARKFSNANIMVKSFYSKKKGSESSAASSQDSLKRHATPKRGAPSQAVPQQQQQPVAQRQQQPMAQQQAYSQAYPPQAQTHAHTHTNAADDAGSTSSRASQGSMSSRGSAGSRSSAGSRRSRSSASSHASDISEGEYKRQLQEYLKDHPEERHLYQQYL